MDDRRNKKGFPLTPIFIAAVYLIFTGGLRNITVVLAVLALVGAPIALFVLALKKSKNRKKSLDDCPKPVCFHTDRGEHHVRKGQEIDPWDRPDIDISKYQRRN